MANTDETMDTTEEVSESEDTEKGINLQRHTATVDKLVLQIRDLNKQLTDREITIEELEHKLNDKTIKISKNLFYIFIAVSCYFLWVAHKQLDKVNNSVSETNIIIREYKSEIDRFKELLPRQPEKIK